MISVYITIGNTGSWGRGTNVVESVVNCFRQGSKPSLITMYEVVVPDDTPATTVRLDELGWLRHPSGGEAKCLFEDKPSDIAWGAYDQLDDELIALRAGE